MPSRLRVNATGQDFPQPTIQESVMSTRHDARVRASFHLTETHQLLGELVLLARDYRAASNIADRIHRELSAIERALKPQRPPKREPPPPRLHGPLFEGDLFQDGREVPK
jgi:hypothetical protein